MKIFIPLILILVLNICWAQDEKWSHQVLKFNDIEVVVDFKVTYSSSSGSYWKRYLTDKDTWINVKGKNFSTTDRPSIIFSSESGEFKIIELNYAGDENGGKRFTGKLGFEYLPLFETRDTNIHEEKKYRWQVVLKHNWFLHPVQTFYPYDSKDNRY
jgi:hypothetical protein